VSTSHIHSDVTPTAVTVVSTPEIPREVREAAERLGVGQYFDKVAAFTIEVFGSIEAVHVAPDPEIPGYEYIAFAVPVTGTVENILEKDRRWSRRLLATIPKVPRIFAIDMDYKE
jgi:hypothetical protein